jgi:aromatic ring hydroxylase-like protein
MSLLVRPDGFVAWRAETATEDPEGKLEQALSRLLCRMPGAPPEAARGSSRVRRRVGSGSSFGPES